MLRARSRSSAFRYSRMEGLLPLFLSNGEHHPTSGRSLLTKVSRKNLSRLSPKADVRVFSTLTPGIELTSM